MRALLVFLSLVAMAIPAFADTDVVLGPVATGGSAAQVSAAAKALRSLSPHPVAAACVSDPACLAKAGADAGGKRVIAVSVGKGGKLTLVVVDVEGALVLGEHDVKLKELPGAVGKVAEEATIAKAKALFAEGNQHYSLGEFDQAMESYSLAYRLKPLPAFLLQHRAVPPQARSLQGSDRDVPELPRRRARCAEQGRRRVADQGGEGSPGRRGQAARRPGEDGGRPRGEADRAEQKKAEDARKAKEAEARAAEERRQAEALRIQHEKETYNRHPSRKWMFATAVLGAAGIGVGGVLRRRRARARSRTSTRPSAATPRSSCRRRRSRRAAASAMTASATRRSRRRS